MPRVHTVTESWSDEARQILAEGAAAGHTAADVTSAIADQTGEDVAERTVSRRLAELRQAAAVRLAARERMQDLVAALKEGNGSASEYIQALAMRALELEPDGLTSADPVKLQRLSLRGEELRLKGRAMEIKARQVALDEQRLSLLVEKEKHAIAALEEDKGEKLTDEQRLEEIRSIYGIRTERAK